MPRGEQITFSIKGLMDLDVSQLTQQVDKARASLNKLSMPKNIENSFTNLFKKIGDQILDFEQKSKRTFGSMDEIRAAEKSYAKLQQYIEDFNFALSKVDMSKLSIKDTSSIKGLQEGLRILENFEKQTQDTEKQMSKLQSQLSKKLQSKIDVSSLVEAASSGENLGRQLATLRGQNTRLQVDSSDIESAEREIDELNKQLQLARAERNRLSDIADNKTATKEDREAYERQIESVQQLDKALRQARARQEELTKAQQEYSNNVKIIDQIAEAYEELRSLASIDFSQIFGGDEPNIQPINNLVQALQQLQQVNLNHVEGVVKETSDAMGDLGTQARVAGQEIRGVADAGTELTDLNNQVQQLTNSFLDFFSLTNGWNLLQQAIRSAYETVKELDASMTEIAVVSDYSLDDIWAMRAEYSDEATLLGAQTIDLVDATKLYVQQGLDLNEAMEVGIETTKMARIANLDGAEATNLMTAALRGFNMEMTQANEVNDVYSELAAITAADTEEIAVAMSKTASIANNAGSSFENMSAFLAQIIETTREAPETAGTAMKTIIARFQELKKPMEEIGEIEGEIVDANKIETALREAGVALRDTSGQFRDFDDVILELADKWDTLDLMTQRYIATQAAGSRQQSRFLALMSDQERLTELVIAANNAQGSANRQYEKTLDSLQSKINELNNALDIFWTNLANNTIIKTTIDLLTGLLNIVNSLVGVFSQSENVVLQFVGSILQIALLYVAFKGATALIRSFSATITNTMGVAGTQSSNSFITNLKAGFTAGIPSVAKEVQDQIAKEFNANKGFMRGSGNTQDAMTLLGFGDSFKGLSDKQLRKVMNPRMLQSLRDDIYESLNFKNLGSKVQSQIDSITNQALDSIASGQSSIIAAFTNLQNSLNNIEIKTDVKNKDGQIIGQIKSKGVGQARISEQTQALALQNVQLQKTQNSLLGISAAAGAASLGLASVANLLDKSGNTEAAEVFNQIATVLGIIGTVAGIATPIMGALGATTAAAGTAAQVGWAPFLPILYGILAVIGIVGGLFIGVSAAIETDAEKLEKLNDVLDKTQAEINSAKESLEDLNTQKDQLATMDDDLANLTRGTSAWKEQLIAINQQVLSLINTYPELAAYLERGIDGQLSVSQEGFNTVIENQQNRIAANQTAQLGARQQKANIENRQAIQDFRSDNYTSYLLNDSEYEELALRMVEEGLSAQRSADRNEIEQIYTDITGSSATFNEFYNNLTGLGAAFDDFANTVYTTNEAMATERDAMIDSAIAGDTTLSTSDFSGQAAAIAGLNYENIGAQIEAEQEKLEKSGGGVTDKVKDEYIGMTDLTEEEVDAKLESGELTNEMINQSVASDRIQEDMIDNMKDINAEFTRLSNITKNTDLEDDFNALQNLMTSEASGMTRSNIDNILSGSGAEDVESITDEQIEAYLTNLRTSLSDIGITANQFREQLVMAQETFDDANNRLEAWGQDGTLASTIQERVDAIDNILRESFGEELTVGQISTLNDIMMDIASRGGDVEGFAEQFEEIINLASTNLEDPEELAQLMTLLASADWGDSEAIQETIKQLKDLGLNIDNDLTTKLIDASAALAEVDLESLNEALLSLGDTIDIVIEKIEAGEGSFTQEEYEQLIEQGIDESSFTRTGIDEYTYNGESLQEILDTLEGKTIDTLSSSTESLDKLIAQAQALEDYFSSEAAVPIENEEGWNTQEFIQAIVNGTITPYSEDAEGYTITRDQLIDLINTIGITSETPLSTYGSEGLIGLITSWYNAYLSKEQNEAERESIENSANDLRIMEESANSIEVAAAGGSIEQQIAKDRQNAEELGINITELDAYKQSLREINAELDEAQISQIALANTKMNLGLSEIIDTYEEWTGLIDETTGLINASSSEDVAAFNRLKKSINTMLNTSEDLSDEFWNNAENMENIKAAAEGDVDALGELQKAAAQDYLVNLALDPENNFSEEAINSILTLSDFIAGYELPKLNVGEVLDNEAFIIRCNELINAAGLTADEVSKAFLGMGYDVKFAANPQPVEETKTVPVVKYSTLTNRMGMITKMIPHVRPETYTFKSSVPAPTIETLTSIGSQGGGVSSSNISAGSANRTSSSRGGGSSGSSSEPEDPWESDYDWLYNLVNKTEEETRTLTKLQWEYDRAIRASGTSARELLNNLEEQEESLRRQQEYYRQQQSGRYEELGRVESEYSDVGQYAWYNRTTGYVEIDWDAIDALSGQTGNNETGERIDEYISKLEEIQDQIDETEDSLMDIEDQIAELDEQGWDEYLDLEQRIFDAIVQLRQDEIDKLTELNDSINNANTEMLNKIQTGIDDYRNDRQLEEDAQDIQEMENRLALMQTDTSGANALDILNLQEELRNARQNYTDSLIDKSIDEMTRQNEQAYEQRQMQIDLMIAQLEWDQESGAIAQQTNQLMTEYLKNGPTEMIKLLQNTDLFEGMAAAEREDWVSAIEDGYAQGMSSWVRNHYVSNTGQTVTFTDSSGVTRTGTITGKGQVKVGNTTYSGVYQTPDGNFTQELEGGSTTETPQAQTQTTTTSSNNAGANIPSKGWGVTVKKGAKFRDGQNFNEAVRSSGFDPKHKGGFYVYQQSGDYYLLGNGGPSRAPNWTGWVHRQYLTPYATGGLADFTGPAWLDGSKAHPELVLNAKDTENFIQLKNILADGLDGQGSSGDNYYDVHIEVDQIANDYDVEQMMDRMRRLIEEDAAYRNVNAVDIGRR